MGQPLTHMFMHGDVSHIFFNMFALWMFGTQIENLWGPKRFLNYYLIPRRSNNLLKIHFYGQHFQDLTISHLFRKISQRSSYLVEFIILIEFFLYYSKSTSLARFFS